MILIKQDGIIHSAIMEPGETILSAIVRDYDSSEYDTENGIDSLGVDRTGKVYRKTGCVILPHGQGISDISMKEYLKGRIEGILGKEDKNVCLEGNVAEIPFATLFAILEKHRAQEDGKEAI